LYINPAIRDVGGIMAPTTYFLFNKNSFQLPILEHFMLTFGT